MVITEVIPNTDSVKIRFQPFPGAKDYRVFLQSDPTRIKYAGVHFFLPPSGHSANPDGTVGAKVGAKVFAAPALEIELNGLPPGIKTTVFLQAVDALGPVCDCNLYTDQNMPMSSRMTDPDAMLGGNSGCALDGNTTINGQGNKDNSPRVLSQVIFAVTASGKPALPSSPIASQVFFDTFASGTITPVGIPDARTGIAKYSLVTPAAGWEVRTENADTLNTAPMLKDGHAMDILFDGGTPGSGNPLHQGHGVFSFSPSRTADFGSGQVLHITAEVDAHLTNVIRRWIDFRLTPANDPYLAFETKGRVNRTNTDLMVQVFGNVITVDQRTGDAQPGAVNSPALSSRIVGAPGQGMYTDCNRPAWTQGGALLPGNPVYQIGKNLQLYQQGRGLDNRSRFDLFVSRSRFALYEDGVKITEHDFPTALPFTVAKIYFSHYMYHSALGVQEIANTTPWEFYWLKTFPYSDERHWDNMGFEVLPASTDWKALAGVVK